MTSSRALHILVWSLLALAACGGGASKSDNAGSDAAAGQASSSGGSSSDEVLPASCELFPSNDDDCAAKLADKPSAVVCRGETIAEGAPPDMILRLSCKYFGAVVGAGNVYCCPQR